MTAETDAATNTNVFKTTLHHFPSGDAAHGLGCELLGSAFRVPENETILISGDTSAFYVSIEILRKLVVNGNIHLDISFAFNMNKSPTSLLDVILHAQFRNCADAREAKS